MLDKHVGRAGKLSSFSQQDMYNYAMVKRRTLKLMYCCARNSNDPDSKGIIPSIVAELEAGSDCSQLTAADMQAAPFDYIRQVCMLPASAADQQDYGEEAVVAENKRLLRAFQAHQAKRYRQQLELFASAMNAPYVQKAASETASAQQDASREELIAEGEQVSQMIQFSSVVPERENLPYYIISMGWYQRW